MCIRDSFVTNLAFGAFFHKQLSVVGGQLSVNILWQQLTTCLLYTSDAADERSSVDLGGRRIIKKKKKYNKQ